MTTGWFAGGLSVSRAPKTQFYNWFMVLYINETCLPFSIRGSGDIAQHFLIDIMCHLVQTNV